MRYILAALLTIATLTAIAQDKAPVQCEAQTTKHQQCARKATIVAKDGKNYCTQHNPDRPHCAGTTGSGTPCKRAVQKEGDRCNDHYFQKKA